MTREADLDVVTIVGATSWGTTLAILLARTGRPIRLLVRDEVEATVLRSHGENRRRLAGFPFPPSLLVLSDPARALSGSGAIVLVVPSQTVRSNMRRIATHIDPASIVVSASKGIEIETGMRMSQVIAEEAPSHRGRIAVVSGPNLGREIAAGLPAATVVAASEPVVADRVQDLLLTPSFRVYTNRDIVGVELGGALKNVIALAAGIVEGLGMGDNAKAGLITRGLAEMTRLGVALGAHSQTFAGLAGLGDLVATCSSKLSRNHRVGILLGAGESPGRILAELDEVAEGVPTTRAVCRLARSMHLELPVSEMMNRVLDSEISPREAATALMLRERRSEF